MKIREFFLKIREIFFFFVLKCKQKEHVHNLNRTKNLLQIKVKTADQIGPDFCDKAGNFHDRSTETTGRQNFKILSVKNS